MTPHIQKWIENLRRDLIARPGRVLEVGSRNVNGTVRQYFEDADSYTGVDMEAGDNVDRVLYNDALLATFGSAFFDTILCLETLEHDIHFWRTAAQLPVMLKLDGLLILTTPANGFPYHGYPKDYWRFTEDAYRDVFFANLHILCLETLDAPAGQHTLAGCARKVRPVHA